MKYYELVVPKDNNGNDLPVVSGVFIKDKFLNTGGAGLNRFFQSDPCFDCLTVSHLDKKHTFHKYYDYYLWDFSEQIDGRFFPVSAKFKALIESFNCPPNRFYEAKIHRNNLMQGFYVWQVYRDTYEEYIDFELTLFNNLKTNRQERKGHALEVKKFDSMHQLLCYSKRHWDFSWNYHRLVLRADFRNLDYCIFPYKLGVVVSERLKNAMTSSGLLGLDFSELPIEFEFSDSYKK